MKKYNFINTHVRVLFANAINKDALKKACNDPEFIKIVNKIKRTQRWKQTQKKQIT